MSVAICDACGVAITGRDPHVLHVRHGLYSNGFEHNMSGSAWLLCVRCADDAEREIRAALAPILARRSAA